jgi:8-oxo-dGTP pyrophosphatase MutT (NUDIX family)
MGHDGISSWERQEKALHADCRVYKILKERWSNEKEASEADFYVMEVADWAVTMALTEEGNCVLVRQFRFGTEGFSWELPAGVVDPGEDPIAGGERELYEESGYRGSKVTLLGSVHPNPAIQRNSCHFILVENARRVDAGAPGPHEFFEVEEVPLETLFSWVRDGTITHAIVHAALFYLRDYLEKRGHSGLEAK